jgi:alkylhydroperoxidase family enzyme
MSWGDDAKVQAVLADVDTAPIDDKLRATLKLLGKLTKNHEISADDIRPVLALGVTKSQIEDAFAVCFAFNVIDRLADTFEFEVGPRAAFDGGARHLLKRGYAM